MSLTRANAKPNVMGAMVPERAPATPRETLADVRPRCAKATLRPQEGASRLRESAADALQTVTSQKAAALDIGIHEGRLSHKLRDGSLTLKQLETLGPTYAAALGEQLTERYGEARESPKAYARRLVNQIESLLVELKQFIEAA